MSEHGEQVAVEDLKGGEETEFGAVLRAHHETDGVDVEFSDGTHHFEYGEMVTVMVSEQGKQDNDTAGLSSRAKEIRERSGCDPELAYWLAEGERMDKEAAERAAGAPSPVDTSGCAFCGGPATHTYQSARGVLGVCECAWDRTGKTPADFPSLTPSPVADPRPAGFTITRPDGSSPWRFTVGTSNMRAATEYYLDVHRAAPFAVLHIGRATL